MVTWQASTTLEWIGGIPYGKNKTKVIHVTTWAIVQLWQENDLGISVENGTPPKKYWTNSIIVSCGMLRCSRFFPARLLNGDWKQFELMQLLKIDVLLVLVRSGWSEGFWRCLGPRRPYCNPLPYVAWFYSPSFRIKTGIFRCSYTVSSVTGACATRLNENDIPLEPNLSISS